MFVIPCVLLEWNQICVGFFFFIVLFYICVAVGGPVIKRGGLGSHLPVQPLHIFVHVPDQVLDFQRHICHLFYVCSVSEGSFC